MARIPLKEILNQKGQAAVEYILLLVVMVSIISSLLVYVRNKYLGNPEDCRGTANKSKILCKINSYIEPTGGQKPFQYYPFKK